ncbi:uncharacterized protein LOC135165444 [Diachasmimorpha longicaudata]|uniref:uncharacterized protein LOC135165444 n=1 Tax=Diachasmimorpha longicaudata TaxID=58733 RepID=UPI0030B875A5
MDSTRLIVIVIIFFTSVVVSTCLQGESASTEDDRRPSLGGGCACIKYDCGCCEHVETLGINGTVCSNITYLPDDYGIWVTLTYNDKVLYNNSVSLRNPPDICVGIPELDKLSAEICLKLYDLTFQDKHYHGCVAIKVSIFHLLHKIVNIGCFNLPVHIHSAKMENAWPVLNHIIDREAMKKDVLPSVQMI